MAHARQRYPEESGGVFVQIGADTVFKPSRYISRVRDHFAISPYEWLEAERDGRIVGFFHSHVNWPPLPGPGDLTALNAWGKPWIIASMPSEEWAQFEPTTSAPRVPLLGRPFVHGSTDCYSLVADAYARLGIELPRVPREDKWWEKGFDLYRENFIGAGFVKMPRTAQLQLHDLLVLQVGKSQVPNHGALYIGEGKIFHHIGSCEDGDLRVRLSARAIYGDYYQTATSMILRHRDLCQ